MGWPLMAEFPALPLWTDAYLGDTAHLTTIEHGAYFLLLMTAWRSKDTRLPDDDRLLARYTRCTVGQWKRLRPIIAQFFIVENGFWTQGRLTDEAVAVRQKRDAAAANGRASALKRKGRHSAKREQSVSGASTDGQRESNLTINHSHIPLSNDNGGETDVAFWDASKAYLSGESKNPGALIGKWCRDYGKLEAAEAITRAQVERPAQRIPFVEAILRKKGRTQPAVPL